jgi:hypothetical protein
MPNPAASPVPYLEGRVPPAEKEAPSLCKSPPSWGESERKPAATSGDERRGLRPW